jgi:hypothetical protein
MRGMGNIVAPWLSIAIGVIVEDNLGGLPPIA